MRWERAALWLIAGLFVVGVITWLAVAAAERFAAPVAEWRKRRERKRRCGYCAYVSENRAACKCESGCPSPRCPKDPARETRLAA